MNWLFFMHFYQPANQQKDILEAVVKESYLPIFRKLNNLNTASITINITGSLLELFVRDGYTELLDLIRQAVKSGKVELTGSCKYHTFLPLMPHEELKRQIKLNEVTTNEILGFDYKAKGFFPPEMGYSPEIGKLISDMGFKWIIIDEIAGSTDSAFPTAKTLHKIEGTNMQAFYRNRRASNLIMSAVARDVDTIFQSLNDDLAQPYMVTGMDGETFGHHRIGFEQFLFELLDNPDLNITSMENFYNNGANSITEIQTDPKASTWATSISDINKGIQFLSWKDPSNEIHKIQWEFLEYTLDLVYKYSQSNSNYEVVRNKMDMALASDHFWWASAKPWWSLEMIEDGAFRFLDVIENMEGISEEILYTGYRYYLAIVSKASAWQREGVVRQMATEQNEFLRIPFKDRTLGKGGAEEGVYYAFIDLMKEEEKKAAMSGNYEKAVLWRDSIFKLENKYDIYDTINVIDLLRIDVGNARVEEVINKYKEEYRVLRGGQPEQRGN